MKPGVLVQLGCDCHKEMWGITIGPSIIWGRYRVLILDPRSGDNATADVSNLEPKNIKEDVNPLIYKNAWLCLANNFGEQDNKEALKLMDAVLKSAKEAFNDIT